MEPYIVRVLKVDKLTHDVLRIRTEKPSGYSYVPGQATELAIKKKNWEKEKRAFTFTGLPLDDHLEFIIKTYPSHEGVTNQLLKLAPNDELIIHDSWGAIEYRGAGLFIAGGAGVTPFISIFRQLANDNLIVGNRLVFANKTKNDIILEGELNGLLGEQFINILSDEPSTGHKRGFVTQELLNEMLPGFNEHIYLCGPPAMMGSVMRSLLCLGVSEKSVTMEV